LITMHQKLALFLPTFLYTSVGAFVTSSGVNTASFDRTFLSPRTTQLRSSATVDVDDDILKPKYEIEPLQTRIGHGFDIHRMAPIEEAGQPIVIGGVIVEHKDQKVRIVMCPLRLSRRSLNRKGGLLGAAVLRLASFCS